MNCPQLKQRLKQNPISVHDFMNHVLYHPNEGYYANSPVLGPLGDYVTSPQMTQAFGEVMAAWFVHQWQQQGQKTPIHLIELGPGLGTLMKDMLRVFRQFPLFINSLHIHLVEHSHFFLEKQREAINHHVFWYKTLDTVPEIIHGFSILLAHEFFDALPIEQYVIVSDEKIQRHIQLTHDEKLHFTPQDGPIYETCPLYKPIMAEIEKKLAPTQGSALIIDYGDFTPPPRLGDTLQAIHKHKKVHPLTHVGLADLTHHVDFYTLQSLVSKTVRRTLINQGQFLKNIGFLERTQYLCNKADPFTAKDLTLAAARLTSSAEMGALFKVLILEFVN